MPLEASNLAQDGDVSSWAIGVADTPQKRLQHPSTGQERASKPLPPGYTRILDKETGHWLTIKIEGEYASWWEGAWDEYVQRHQDPAFK